MVGYRSKCREMAFRIIFGLNFVTYKIEEIDEIIENFKSSFEDNDYEINMRFLNKEYCYEILEGIRKNQSEIDKLISDNLKGWKIERLSKVDLAILRLAVFEMCFKMLDPRIAINEAVNLSKEYSHDKSPSYINGVLNSLKDVKIEGKSL